MNLLPTNRVFGVRDDGTDSQVINEATSFPGVAEEEIVIPEMDGKKLDFGWRIGEINPMMHLLDFPGFLVSPKTDSPGIIRGVGAEGLGVVVGVELEIRITIVVDGDRSG